MKYWFFSLFGLLLAVAGAAQKPHTVNNLSLPAELAWYDNQFSGLYIHNGQLFLLSESRLQDGAEGKIYAIRLSDLDRKLRDTAYVLPYQKYHLQGLETIRDKMTAAGQSYEGLEAVLMDGETIYFSVETATPSAYCYLLKGKLGNKAVLMDTAYLVQTTKPVNADGSHIYNAGFEAIAEHDHRIFAFFEYNYFPISNTVLSIDKNQPAGRGHIGSLPVNKIPFRITDITATGKDHYTAINFFFKGEGADTVYRMPVGDKHTELIKDAEGYHNYCRLIDITYTGSGFTWKPLLELPAAYMGYNWEGIAAYKKGYFMINDKYTPARPYMSALLYIQPK
jgi:hypothetical protein